MNCSEAREHVLDLAQAESLPTAGTVQGLQEHLSTCGACAAELESLRATMALLDEWQAPEISPHFDSKLRARVREVAAESRSSWLDWFRKPAIAGAFAMLMVLGLALFHNAPQHRGTSVAMNSAGDTIQQPQRGSAVGDLRDLDQNLDLYANFDALDDLSGQAQEQSP